MAHSTHSETIASAFSQQSPHYDADEAHNEILKVMRRQVREEVLHLLKPGSHILELNAGTGLDAIFFASKGYRVTATDLSPGMVGQIKKKVRQSRSEVQVEVVQSGFHELKEKVSGPFDFVFSNMGGLNCTPDLRPVFDQLSQLLNPGANAILVIMPPVCPWEIATAVKGRWRHAFRRVKKGGTTAHVEGHFFTTYYFSPKKIRHMLPPNWELLHTSGLGALLPQPHIEGFPKKYPKLFKFLVAADGQVRHAFPFNRWADHLVVRLQFRG